MIYPLYNCIFIDQIWPDLMFSIWLFLVFGCTLECTWNWIDLLVFQLYEDRQPEMFKMEMFGVSFCAGLLLASN